MAKETFYNLPDEKRKLIEDISIKEFAEYGYDKASINKIVKKCKIAKGSFYQYFEDKKDLFKYIMSRLAEEKIKYMSPVLMNPMEYNFFKLIEELYISGIKFAATNPQMMIIGNRVFKNKDNPIYQEAIGENMEMAYSIFENLINLAISRKEIRADIDVKFMSYMISSMNVSVVEYCYENYIFDIMDVENWNEKMMDTISIFIDVLRKGIAIKEE